MAVSIIMNLTAAMAKRYVCPVCNKGCKIGAQHRCDASCDARSVIPPCIQEYARNPCNECNRPFRNTECFENYRRLKISGKTVFEVKRRCCRCDALEVQSQVLQKVLFKLSVKRLL